MVYPTLQMLEEMGYATSQKRDGKKIYTITEAGINFLVERKDSADEVRSQIKSRWSLGNIGRMAMVMKEYHAMENLIGHCLRRLDAEKSKQVRQVLIRAQEEIESILEQ